MPTTIGRPSRSAAALAIAALLAAGTSVLAQSAPASDKPATPAVPPAPAPAPSAAPSTEAGLLGGPRVVDKPARTSIVERDSTGNLVRLEVRPEQAALDLLVLTRAEREPVDKILAERLTRVTQLLKDNQALFLKIQGARQGGAKPAEIAPLMQEFRPIARPFVESPLRDQIAAALPEGKRAEFKRLVAEYFGAATAEEAANRARQEMPGSDQAPAQRGGPAGGPPEMIARRAEVNLLLREMGGALRTIVKERREQTEELMRVIDATPEQQAQIQAITRDARYGEGFERTPQQMGDIKRRIDAVLTPEQRQKLEEFRRAQGMGRGPAAIKPPASPEGEMIPPSAQK